MDHFFLCLVLVVRSSTWLRHSITQVTLAVRNKYMCKPSLIHYQDCLKPWEIQGDGYFPVRLEVRVAFWNHLCITNIYAAGSSDFNDYRLLRRCPKAHWDTPLGFAPPSFCTYCFFWLNCPQTPGLPGKVISILQKLTSSLRLWLYSRSLSHLSVFTQSAPVCSKV